MTGVELPLGRLYVVPSTVASPPSIKVCAFSIIPVPCRADTTDGNVKVVVRVEPVIAMVAPAGTVVPRREMEG
jgi:hypothetical protein